MLDKKSIDSFFVRPRERERERETEAHINWNTQFKKLLRNEELKWRKR
jgi:hypothetical protein